MRRLKYAALGLASFALLFGAESYACQLKRSHHWFDTAKELTARTYNILYVEATKIELSKTQSQFAQERKRLNIEFKVIEVLKGRYEKSDYRLAGVAREPKDEFQESLAAIRAKHAYKHTQPIKKPRHTRDLTVVHDSSCALDVSGFHVGERYVIFVSGFNSKAYRRVVPNDPWIREVKRLVKEYYETPYVKSDSE